MKQVFLISKGLLYSACLILFLNACNKADIPTPSLKQTETHVTAWLNSQKAVTDPVKNNRISLLGSSLIFSQSYFEDFRDGEHFIVVPIQKSFPSINNTGKKYTSALLLIEDKKGNIRKGCVVQYIPENEGVSIPKNSFSRIFNAEEFKEDGQFTFVTLTDLLEYQVQYKKGMLAADGRRKNKQLLTTGGEPSIVNVPPQNPISPDCVDWYLVTTYYYADGTTSQTQQFLYNTCNNGGGNGTGQTTIEYEFEAYRLTQWAVYIFPGNIYSVQSFENIKGRRVASEPQGGHFKSITHHSDECSNPYGIWGSSSISVSHNGAQSASSSITGGFTPNGGVLQNISKVKTWTFQSLFP